MFTAKTNYTLYLSVEMFTANQITRYNYTPSPPISTMISTVSLTDLRTKHEKISTDISTVSLTALRTKSN